ncbi:MAG: hypothetical protein AB1430_07910 [Pseudomonadota bacterium]
MTSTSIRAPGPAGRDAGACIEDDLRLLADQLQRCVGSQGRWARWQSLLSRMRAFTVTHVTSVAAALGLAGGVWVLMR